MIGENFSIGFNVHSVSLPVCVFFHFYGGFGDFFYFIVLIFKFVTLEVYINHVILAIFTKTYNIPVKIISFFFDFYFGVVF